MAIRVGTSGFSYVEWKGTFYPEKLPQKKMLAYYAERFSTVEINATFYRMPKSDMLAGWLPEVCPEPPGPGYRHLPRSVSDLRGRCIACRHHGGRE